MESLSEAYVERLRSRGISVVRVDLVVRMLQACDASGFSRGMVAAIEQLGPFVASQPGGPEKLSAMLESLMLLGSEMIADFETKDGAKNG
jgi:hypothetical protein